MGKLGSRELNYSSDIDLIVLYDRAKVDYRGRRTLQDCFVRIVRDLVRLLQDHTEDGYVFRTDLGCVPIRARHRSPCRCSRPRPITRAWGKIGNAPP